MLTAEATTSGRIAAAVQTRLRQPRCAGIAAAARMRSTRARTVQARAHFQPRRGVANPLHEIEQNFGVGASVLDHLDRRASLITSASSARRVSCHQANGLNQNTARLKDASSST